MHLTTSQAQSKLSLLAAILALADPLTGNAQFKRLDQAKVFPPGLVYAVPGAVVEAPVRLQVFAAYHINAEKPTFDYMIPTKLEWTSSGNLKLLGVDYPRPEKRTFGFAPEKPLEVYQGEVVIRSRFQAPPAAKREPPYQVKLTGKLTYQACDDKVCYPPVTVAVTGEVEILPKGK